MVLADLAVVIVGTNMKLGYLKMKICNTKFRPRKKAI